ncbi:hypothetical protein BSKO_12635 [Bryopsis sp. KO-2023]|nr:hypothetical protein BSKO_12635 [Bryopsis sp. KO-2023]
MKAVRDGMHMQDKTGTVHAIGKKMPRMNDRNRSSFYDKVSDASNKSAQRWKMAGKRDAQNAMVYASAPDASTVLRSATKRSKK